MNTTCTLPIQGQKLKKNSFRFRTMHLLYFKHRQNKLTLKISSEKDFNSLIKNNKIIETSESYCSDYIIIAIFSSFRYCDKGSQGWGGCDILCCGRGYKSFTREIVERCECKYYWCCYVKCKECTKTLHLNVCR